MYLSELEKSGVCLHLLNLRASGHYLVMLIIYKCFSYFTTKQNKITFIVCNLFFNFHFDKPSFQNVLQNGKLNLKKMILSIIEIYFLGKKNVFQYFVIIFLLAAALNQSN